MRFKDRISIKTHDQNMMWKIYFFKLYNKTKTIYKECGEKNNVKVKFVKSRYLNSYLKFHSMSYLFIMQLTNSLL